MSAEDVAGGLWDCSLSPLLHVSQWLSSKMRITKWKKIDVYSANSTGCFSMRSAPATRGCNLVTQHATLKIYVYSRSNLSSSWIVDFFGRWLLDYGKVISSRDFIDLTNRPDTPVVFLRTDVEQSGTPENAGRSLPIAVAQVAQIFGKAKHPRGV